MDSVAGLFLPQSRWCERAEENDRDACPAPPHGGNPTSWTTAWNRGSGRSGAQRRSRLSHTSQCVRCRTPRANHAKALSLRPSAVCTSATAYAVTYCRRDRESMRTSAAWASRRLPRTPYTYPSAATVGTQLRSGPVVAYCDSALSIWLLAW